MSTGSPQDMLNNQLGERTDLDAVDAKILEVIAKAQRLPPECVTPEKTFQELNIDSLDSINIVFELEEEFRISISEEQARSITKVSDVIHGVKLLVQESLATSDGESAS